MPRYAAGEAATGPLLERYDGADATLTLEFDVVMAVVGVEEGCEDLALAGSDLVLDAHAAGLEVGGEELGGDAYVAAVVHVVVVVDVVTTHADGRADGGLDLGEAHTALGVLHGVLLVVGEGVYHLLREAFELAGVDVDEGSLAVADVAGLPLGVANDVVAESEEGFALVDGRRDGEAFAQLRDADDVDLPRGEELCALLALEDVLGEGFGLDPHIVAVVHHLEGGEELEALVLVDTRRGTGFLDGIHGI